MCYRELRVASISPEITVPYFGDSYSFSICHFAAVLSIEEYFRYEVDLPGRDTATKDGSLVSALIKMLSVCRIDSPILTSFTNYTAILRRIFNTDAPQTKQNHVTLRAYGYSLFIPSPSC
jgi:hypothetical protein